MTNRLTTALAVATAVALGAAILDAQGRGGSEWTTSGFDAQRSGWIRTDPRISVDAMQKPGAFGPFKFLWKLKLEHDPNAPGALTEPIFLDRLIGFRGFKSIAFVATASETVHAIDIDFGVPLWKYHINYTASLPPVLTTTQRCPGGLSAALSRPTAIASMAADGRGGGGGRGGRSGGGVGEPGKGSITLATAGRGRGAGPEGPGAPGAAPGAAVPGSAAAAAGVAPGGLPAGARAGGPGGGGGGFGGGPFVPGGDAAYIVGSDGYLHALNVQNGWDSMTPALFLPANTRPMGLIIATGADGRAVAYIATTHGCGSQPDAVWAMDLGSPQKPVVAYHAGGATIAGTAGPALGRDGTVYVSTTDGSAALSNSVIALEPRALKLKASVAVPKADFSSSPLVFQWKETDAVVAAGGGKLLVFDGAVLQAGPLASASFGTAGIETGALASWLDAQRTRWIAVPSARGIATFKVVEQDGRPALLPGWTSREIASPLPPLVINGVLFAASSGTRAAPAVLYAIDAATGKDLWNSGKTITSSVRGRLSGEQGNVYVPGSDSTLYAFGFEIEK
jgi:outer membrane protein assembly factor BamB